MRWAGPAEVASALPPLAAIAAVEEALVQHSKGLAHSSGRQFIPSGGTPLALMPGSVAGRMGLKALTVVESNPGRGLPAIQGTVLLFDDQTGELIGAVDGPSLTAVRTAAIAGLATRLLAVTRAESFLMVGAGAQARAQVEAVLAVRPIRRVSIWNRTPARARELALAVSAAHQELAVDTATDLASAAAQADVITLATSSQQPLLGLAGLRPDCHVNAIGAYRPDRRELSSELVVAARVFADTTEGCLEEAGDLLFPIAEGRLDRTAVRPLLEARAVDRDRLTVMKSVGSSIFDLACASRVLEPTRD